MCIERNIKGYKGKKKLDLIDLLVKAGWDKEYVDSNVENSVVQLGEPTAEICNNENSNGNGADCDEGGSSKRRSRGNASVPPDDLGDEDNECSFMLIETDEPNDKEKIVNPIPDVEKNNSSESSHRGDCFGAGSRDTESALISNSMISYDEILSRTDDNPDGTERFDFTAMDSSMADLCKIFTNVPFHGLDCPMRAHLDKETEGSPNVEMNENSLYEFFNFMKLKIGDLSCYEMLDVGSGYGMPSFVGHFFHGMSSHGVEISTLHVRTSLMMLLQYKKEKEKTGTTIKISFISKDLKSLSSFNPFSLIYAASKG